MSIAAIRNALAAAIEVTGVQATAYVTEQVNTPQAVVVRGEVTYNYTFDPTHGYAYQIRVYAGRSNPAFGQTFLDDLVEPEGPTSIREALQTDVALNALVQRINVIRASVVQDAVVGETGYLYVDFDVEVIA